MKNMKNKIIAELAQGFEGDLTKAKLLVNAAASSGADIVKLQLVYADELATPDYLHYKLFKSLEMPDNSWKELLDYSKELNIELNFDVFGTKSLNLCQELGIKGIKLHGTDMTNIGLLNEVFESNIKNIYLGAGGSNLTEIKLAISILKNKNIILLLGFQSYPTPNNDNQISRVSYLKEYLHKKYNNVEIGFADHPDSNSSLGFALAATAVGAGATVIEKHLTLGKIMKMEDYESALNPDEFYDFTKTIRNCFLALGNTVDSNDFGMSNSEKKYRKMIRRHVASSKDLKKGTVLNSKNLVLKRTAAKNVIYDISSVYGKKLTDDLIINTAINQNIIK
jgi:N,N'-diacetyllegionaminate synthase